MILPCGAYVVYRRHGVHKHDPRCTIHLVDIWRSEADFKAGKPSWQRQDHFHHAPGPMSDPAAAILAAINGHCVHPDNAHLSGDCSLGEKAPWGDGADMYGNLAHPSMQALQAVPE